MSIIKERKKINKLTRTTKNIFLMAHKDLDLDALGSCIGMYMILKKKRKNCFIIIDDKEQTVVDAVKAAGLEVLEVTYQGEWVSVTAKKPE